MSEVKERILGAVTIMSEQDAEKVWELIKSVFALSNAESDMPDSEEIKILEAYRNGDPDYQATISQEQLLQELNL